PKPTLLSGSWKRQLGVQAGSQKVGAELLDGRELNSLESQRLCSLDVDQFVVQEERFLGAGAEFVEHVKINGRVGFGHVQLIAPNQDVEAGQPVELPFHIRVYVVAHVGEDRGADAALLELELPGQHGGILGGPHASIPQVELFCGPWREAQTCL